MIRTGIFHFSNLLIGLEFAILTVLVLTAAVYDIKTRRVPNKLIVFGILISLAYQTYSGYGFIFWLTGLAVGFASLFPLYILRAMGAGDVKLMALVGSFIGGIAAFQTTLLTLVAGGVLSLLVVFWRRSWKLVFKNLQLMCISLSIGAMTKQLPKMEVQYQSAGNLPYGVAIAAGTLLYICFFRP